MASCCSLFLFSNNSQDISLRSILFVLPQGLHSKFYELGVQHQPTVIGSVRHHYIGWTINNRIYAESELGY
jgi:hypothetical protein